MTVLDHALERTYLDLQGLFGLSEPTRKDVIPRLRSDFTLDFVF